MARVIKTLHGEVKYAHKFILVNYHTWIYNADLLNQKESKQQYQSEDSVTPTADKIEVVWSNMSELCNKAMMSGVQNSTDLIPLCMNQHWRNCPNAALTYLDAAMQAQGTSIMLVWSYIK